MKQSSFTEEQIAFALRQAEKGVTTSITVGHSTEFTSRALADRAWRHDSQRKFSRETGAVHP
jgi:hypothetical protein